jgi:ATP-dependent Clp protease, protease subunit
MKFKPMWEFRQSTQPDTLELYIYGDVAGDYYDWWDGVMIESETSANHFRQTLAEHPDAKQINVYINSWGGSVFEGTAIFSQLKRHPAHKTAYIDGFACSIAAVIPMACDEVIMPRNTQMMIHNIWNVVAGNATQLRKAAADLEVIYAANRQAFLMKANGKLQEEQLIQMLDAETWLTAEQCIQYGLADRYADQDADMSQAQEMLQKMNQTMAQQLSAFKGMAAMLRQVTTVPTALPAEPEAPPVAPPPSAQQEATGGIRSMLQALANI